MRRVLAVLVVLGASLGFAVPTRAATAAAGYAVSVYAKDFPSSIIGPIGLAFDRSNRLVVADWFSHKLYRFPPGGGSATANEFADLGGTLYGVTFGKDGRLYVVRDFTNDVAEVDQTTGAVVRVVASLSGMVPVGIVTDPISGDLFVTANSVAQLVRISHPATTPSTSVYATGFNDNDGIAVGPDGTFYVADRGTARILSVTATNSAHPGTVGVVTSIANSDGMAIGASADPSKPPFLVVNRTDGVISKITLQGTPVVSNIVTGGERGDFVTVGADGCLYATQVSSILRITHSDGTCDLAPNGDAPVLVYTGDTARDYHDVVHLSARLTTKSGAPIADATLSFLGAGLACSGKTDSAGNAACSVVANVPADTSALTVKYAGSAGIYAAARTTIDFTVNKEETTLTTQPVRAENQHAIQVSATLLEDATVPIAARTIKFAAAGAQCTGVTNASGVASCALDIATAKTATMTASFATDDYYLAASASADLTIAQMFGRARSLVATLLGAPVAVDAPDTGDLESQDAGSTRKTTDASAPPFSSGALLASSVAFSKGPDRARSTSDVADVTLQLPAAILRIVGAHVTADATCAGATGALSVAAITLGGVPVAGPNQIDPGSVVPLPGGGSIVLNEQSAIAGGIQVNGVHVTIPGVTDTIVGQVRAGVRDCP